MKAGHQRHRDGVSVFATRSLNRDGASAVEWHLKLLHVLEAQLDLYRRLTRDIKEEQIRFSEIV